MCGFVNNLEQVEVQKEVDHFFSVVGAAGHVAHVRNVEVTHHEKHFAKRRASMVQATAVKIIERLHDGRANQRWANAIWRTSRREVKAIKMDGGARANDCSRCHEILVSGATIDILQAESSISGDQRSTVYAIVAISAADNIVISEGKNVVVGKVVIKPGLC